MAPRGERAVPGPHPGRRVSAGSVRCQARSATQRSVDSVGHSTGSLIPPSGNQRRQYEKTSNSIRPSQNVGIELNSNPTLPRTTSPKRRARTAWYTPSARPSTKSISSAAPVSVSVLGIASARASATGRCRANDSPSSPCDRAHKYFPYCTATGRSYPNCARRRWHASGESWRSDSPQGEPWARWMRKRSEEHTSELQSLAYLVCRLLLEKKKDADDRRW